MHLQVTKLQQEIQSYVSGIQSRVIYGFGVPRNMHSAIIGRGGSTVAEIQTKHSVKIVFPNWNDHSAKAEVVNAAECADVAADDLIRVIGELENCKAAVEDIKVRSALEPANGLKLVDQVKAAPRPTDGRKRGPGPSPAFERTIEVPAKHVRAMSLQSSF
jgi:hypothetical protein